MHRVLTALLLWFALLIVTPSVTLAHECHFVLGFETLRNLIGHDIVGECLEEERHDASGDGLQRTTGGLLVWRKADNRTAFTDGYRTWVNGPHGLQMRLNSERFEWESDYATVTGPEATPTLTSDALRNAEYELYEERVRLENGHLDKKLEYGPGQEAWDLHDPIAFGDLDSDGVDDAAVFLSYSGGGSGTFFHLLAVLNENGTPVHVASYLLGDRIGIKSLEIADGDIMVMMVAHGPLDALCCPTQDTVAIFHLHGNELELVSEDPPGQLTTISQE